MGQGCIKPGQMKATYGTGCFMLLNTGEGRRDPGARLLTTVAARVGGKTTYALEGAIFIAGAAIQWVEQGLGVAGGPQAVEALAGQARDGHGVVLVPAFTGLGAPWWDADARGALFGLTRDAGLPEIASATFDACALQTRDLIEAMREDAPHAFGSESELRIDGGMAKSKPGSASAWPTSPGSTSAASSSRRPRRSGRRCSRALAWACCPAWKPRPVYGPRARTCPSPWLASRGTPPTSAGPMRCAGPARG